MEHLRDVNPETFGVDEAEICRMLGTLPERASRAEVREMLPEHAERIEHIFGTHAEPERGYAIRQVTMYGVAECLRSEMAAELLRAGDIAGFGEFINLSHDGDRVTKLVDGKRVPMDNSLSDARIEQLVADLVSGDPERTEGAHLWRQPGGYDASCEELDTLVDIARATPGVVGAGLVGAGLGGSIVAVVEEQHAQDVINNMAEQYYEPRDLPPSASIVRPVGGSGILRLPA
jgi:galactokinase